MKDESKRAAILECCKKLFSQRGFYNTSISDIVKETGLPVGTIYTYFTSKEAIVQDIVEEGWTDFFGRVQQAVTSALPLGA
ncbi:MAG TPA: TetR/AcrR family transcriptional regulator [Spirochaetia bacterium]|nr:TetR/AcrR family transcriptional regulator [Spirochaetia bacterium]